ncbi:DALR anticodon-binding domain-containing protein [Aerosakkonema funiforme]|uniref:DALR anticodon-binding domain-containing protein n=1 Tax=Aerosakkonema funiforme TaxID=1246630 RepID=UPI0035B73B83
MNEDLPMMDFPAIAYALRLYLQEAMDLLSQKLGIADPDISFDRDVQGRNATGIFDVYQFQNQTQILYVSPIALRLSKLSRIPTADLAGEIVDELYGLGEERYPEIKRYFNIKVAERGWIHWHLSDLAISAWLQRLVEGERGGRGKKEKIYSLTPPLPPTPPHSRLSQGVASQDSAIFAIQYAHARCCSLLRMAHREGAIALAEADPETTPTHWCIVSPKAIPWLTGEKKLRLVHPAERTLICSLFVLLDTLYCPLSSGRAIDWQKIALDLGQTFETFYSRCRIWGEVKTEDPSLSQARLGLFAATQPFLRLLLEDFLAVSAPLEL